MDRHICLHIEGEALVVQGGHFHRQVPGLGPGAVCVVSLDVGDEIYDVE